MSDWPRAPPHRLREQGAYMVTCGTYDTHITFPNSYFPRLKYVHQNPVHHGIVNCAENYPWCSAAWFARSARPAFRATVEGFKTDRLAVADAFDTQLPAASPTESGVKPPHSK